MELKHVISGFSGALSDDFKRRLMKKTGWGRNEIIAEFQAAQVYAWSAIAGDVITKAIESSINTEQEKTK